MNPQRLPCIGLGLAALGRPGYINIGHADDLRRRYREDEMRTRAHAVLDAAWAGEVRYFDAARSYGRAESFLADWLAARSIPRGEITIGSKWGYIYTAGWRVEAAAHEVKDHSLAVLLRQWHESRSILGDALTLYQIHSATLESGVLDDAAVLSELSRLAAGGVTIGVTVSGPAQSATLRKALDVAIDGVPLFRSVQATWNVLEQSCEPVLEEAHSRGLRVIVKEVLANGRLTGRNRDPAFAPHLSLLAGEAARLQTTVDALAIAAALAQSWAGVVLSGAATVEHLTSNLRAREVLWDEEAEAQLSALRQAPREYWNARARLPWN